MKFLEGSKQFVVPLFQRTYSWGIKQIPVLWDDIQKTRDDEGVHFFGSFVTEPLPSSASGVSKYIVIDGQQRLVTTFLFLAMLRNRIKEIDPNSKKKDEIHNLYLINEYHQQDKYKIVPTQVDRQIFFNIIDDKADTSEPNLIYYTQNYFKKEFDKINNIEELEKLKNTILNRFSAVDIRLEKGDNPYLIFESLNHKGATLTQVDLLRNYFFMRISLDKQDEVYKDLWLPMQQSLSERLDSFVRHYLALQGDIPNFENIYITLKEKADQTATNEAKVIQLIKDLVKYGRYYEKLLHPEKEKMKDVSLRLIKLNRLDVTTSYPLLLNFYDDYSEERLTFEDFTKIIKIIETFIIRRAVCNVPTNVLNKYFPTIYNQLDKNNFVESLKQKLAEEIGQRRMPNSTEFKTALINNNLYGDRILKYILEEIENFGNKEVVDFTNLQIEHIMPQKISAEWKKELGKDSELIHQKYVNTLGNLTLTAYNPEYSNRSFPEKKNMKKGFKESKLYINSDLVNFDKWGEIEIIKRAKKLAKIAINIWN